MKCDRIRRLISEGFERRLTPDERMEVREHVHSCAECAAFDRSLHTGLEAIRRLPDITPSPRLWESVHTLTAMQPRATPKRVAHQALGIVGAALTVALVAVVTILMFNNHTGSTPGTVQSALATRTITTFGHKVSPSPTATSQMFIEAATPTSTPPAASTQDPTPSVLPASPTPATVYTTPEPPLLDQQAAQDTVVGYFHAINQHEYAMAYAYLGADLQQIQTYSEFASGFSDTVQDTVTISDITSPQPNELAVSLRLDAEQSDGTTRHFDGTYIVGIEDNVPKIIAADVKEENNGTPVASPAADMTSCLAQDLKAVASYQGATGSVAGSIIFTNAGSGTCILEGTPDIEIVDANGQTLKTTQVAMNLGGSQKPLTLEGGQQAALLFTWSNWCPAGTPDASTATPVEPGLSFRVILSKSGGTVTAPLLQTDGTPITSVPQCDAPQKGSTLSVRGFSPYPDS